MSKRIKIVFLHSYLGVGGAEASRLAILKHFDFSKYEPTVVCLSKKDEIGREIERIGVRVIALKRSWRIPNILTFFSLLKVLKEERPDILQCCMFNAVFYGVLAGKLAGIKHIIAEERAKEIFKKWYHILIDRALFKLTDRIIACSDAVKLYAAKREEIPLSKFVTIRNVVDIDTLNKRIAKTEILKEKKRIGLQSKHYPIIGVVANLRVEKGHIHLFKALPNILNDYPHAKVILLGIGPLERQLKAYVKEHRLENVVIFLGLKRDICLCYKMMDVFVLPSIHEGFGNVLLEAAYCLVPIVASNVDGIPEAVSDRHATLVKPGDSKGLAVGIINSLMNKDKSKLKSARKRVLENFLPNRYLKELEELYSGILNERS